MIWEQRINHGSGWKAMEDRGGVTANHFDHVHVSFKSGAGGGDLGSCSTVTLVARFVTLSSPTAAIHSAKWPSA